MPKTKAKHPGGRPPLPEGKRVMDRPTLSVRLTPENYKWLTSQDESANQIINDLVERARKRLLTI